MKSRRLIGARCFVKQFNVMQDFRVQFKVMQDFKASRTENRVYL